MCRTTTKIKINSVCFFHAHTFAISIYKCIMCVEMCDFAAFIEQRKLNFEGATADSRQFETTYDSGMILIQGVTLTMPIVDSQESVSNGRCSF